MSKPSEQGSSKLCFEATGRAKGDRLTDPINPDIPRVRTWLERFSISRKVSLSSEQQQAVETAAYSKVMVITGGPGVG